MREISLLVYDEAHHCKADSYERLTTSVTEINPDVKVYGVSATPERGDKKGLKPTFDNVCSVLQLEDMVKKGHLVKPDGRVINLGIQKELTEIQKKSKSDFMEQADVEKLMNTQANNNAIVREWRNHADGRQSVFFCATIAHAEAVADAFMESGIEAKAVHSGLNGTKRTDYLKAFDDKEITVLTNPMLLTEGWDSPACSCVGMLRACSFRSTIIQMCGRGLRKNPNGFKKDCIILDFGMSLLTHGNLETNILLDDKPKGVAPLKECPGCGTQIPIQCGECPICGHVFEEEEKEKEVIENFVMTPFQLIGNSPFKWVSLFPGDRVQVVTGFDAWAAVCSPDGETWFAFGGVGKRQMKRLIISDLVPALASADDFMREHETNTSAKKQSLWMNQPSTTKQDQILKQFGYHMSFLGSGMTKIESAAHITFHFNRNKIERLMEL
jgi:hypothetical protein